MMAANALQADQAVILTHLRHITRRWHELDIKCNLEVRILSSDDQAVVKNVARYSPDEFGLDMAADHIAEMNKHKLNAYVVVNPVRADADIKTGKAATDEHIAASFFHWADADDAQAAENIRQFVGPRPTFYVLTGTQPCARPHVYWELEEPTLNMAAWNATQKAIAATLKTDASVVNPSRIMRVAGTVNWPKPKKIAKGYTQEVTALHIHSEDDRPLVTSERMSRAFLPQAAPTEGIHIATGDEIGPSLDVRNTITSALSAENWNTNVNKIVWRLAAKGLTDEEILLMASSLTLPGYSVDQTRDEVLTMLKYAREAGKHPFDEPAAPFQAQTKVDQIRPELEWFDDLQIGTSSNYLIKGFLDQETVSVVYGPSNSGKTFFVLDMAYHLAAGMDWRGRKVRKAAVLYLAAEGGRGIVARIVALRKHTGAEGLPFAVRRGGLDLLKNNSDLESIVTFAKEVGEKAPGCPVVIVVDTLSRVMAGGDENGPVDMTQFVSNMDAIRAITGAHICIVHHSGKDTAKGARGHSSLRAAVDTEIEISPPGDGDTIREATDSKQREHESNRILPFTLKAVDLGVDEEGDPITTCVVEHLDEGTTPRRKKKLTKNQKKLVEAFDQMMGEGLAKPNPAGVGMPEPGRFWVVPSDDLRTVFEGKITAANKRDAFLTAFDALTGPEGPFCMASGFVWHFDRPAR